MALSDEYLHKLRTFYDQEHISVLGFECKHRCECEQDAKPSILLRGAEGYVGPRYGEATKVVFMSLDVGNETEDENRTLRGRRRVFENLPKKLNPHLAGTLAILQALFSEDLEVPQDNPWPFFVLLNAAKCSRRDSWKKVNDRLYDRCRSFAHGELSLLSPDILVTQGKKAKGGLEDWEKISDAALDETIRLHATSSAPSREEITAANRYICLARIAGRRVVAMHTLTLPIMGRDGGKSSEPSCLSALGWLVNW